MRRTTSGRQRRRPATNTVVSTVVTAALTSGLLIGLPGRALAAQNSLQFPSNADYFTLGANGTLMIDGTIAYDDHCQSDGEGGVDDFFYPATDVYLVPAGSAVDGAELHDVNGQPNTIVGTGSGAFLGELIAVAPPTGMLPEGEYDLVYDTCQDGVVSESDEVYSDAVVVDIPDGQLPPVDTSIRALKEKARQEYVSWLQTHMAVTALFNVSQAKDIAACILEANAECLLQILEGIYGPQDILSQIGNRIQDQTLALIANKAASYGAIWQDPADPDFRQLPVVTTGAVSAPPSVGRPLADAYTALGPALQQENALDTALLHAIERYQGAEQAGDAEWALVQARAVRDLSAALDAHLATDRTLPALRDALGADGLVDQVNAGVDVLNRLRTSGFSADEHRALANRGLSDQQIRDLEDKLVAGGSAVHTNASDLVSPFDAAIAADQGMRTALQQTHDGWSAVADQLAERVQATHPEADAGGPYTTATHSVTLYATASKPAPGATQISSYAWDLDGDGVFDDATGATPTVDVSSPRTVSVEVTDDKGGTAVDVATVDVTAPVDNPAVSAYSPVSTAVSVKAGTTQSFSVTTAAPVRWSSGSTGATFDYSPTSADVGEHLITATVGGRVTRTWSVSVLAADADGDGWTATADCDDSRADVHPGNLERVGNGIDDDCDPASSDGPEGGITGSVQTWGNYAGTGTGSFDDQLSPVSLDLGQPVRSIDSAHRVGLAVMQDRTVRSWGQNFDGVLGTTSVANGDVQRTPVTVQGLDGAAALSGVTQVAVDESAVLALRSDGTVVSWGRNVNAQLGDGTTVSNRPAPVRVLTADGSQLTGVAQVETGESTSYAVMQDGSVRNWGVVHCDGKSGTTTVGTAQPAPQFGIGVVQLASGDDGGAVLRRADGSLWTCGDYGPLLGRGTSYGSLSQMLTPRQVPGWGPGSGVVDVAYGSEAAALVKDDGSVWVWGKNLNSALDVLGIPAGAEQSTPTKVNLPPGPPVVDVETDYSSTTFATRADGSVLVWGANTYGSAGIGSTATAVSGTPRVALAGRAVQVADSHWNGVALIRPADDPTWERPAQWVTASVGDGEVTEGTTGSVPLTLSEPAPYDLTVSYVVGDGPTQTAPVAKGATTAALPVTAADDAVDNDDRTVPVQLLSVSHDVTVTGGAATLTVHDDDAAPTVSVGDVTTLEGDTSLHDATVPVTLSASSGKDVSVDWATTDGSAIAPGDYLAAHGTVLIPAGQTTGTIHLSVVGDAVLEPQEHLAIALSQPVDATVADGDATVTITDDEPLRVDVSSPHVTEGDSGTTPAPFTVSVPELPAGDSVTIPWSVKAGTAELGSDVQEASGTVTLTPDQLSQPVTVQVVSDTVVEPLKDETFSLALGSLTSGDGRTVLRNATRPAVITDDDVAVTVDAGSDVDGTEGSPVSITGAASATATWSVADSRCVVAAPGSLSTTVTCPDETDTVLTLRSGDVTDTALLHVANVAPALTVTVPASVVAGKPLALTTTVTDPGTTDTVTCTVAWGDGTSTDGCTGSHTWTQAGSYPVAVTANDGDGGTTTRTVTVSVTAPVPATWPWQGFYAPVDNPPVVNVVKAGSTVPLKFSLGGNRGLGVLASGYPAAAAHGCATAAPLDALESTSTPGEATLVYDATSGQYHLNWKTERAWAGSCRTLVLKLTDGSSHTAEFRFS